jgi:hypothetical protein
MMGPQAQFQQVGQSGAWVSDKMPHLQSVADDISFIKAMYTDQFNHAPAQLLLHTGSARLGRPSTGTWATYGLGSENQNLPGYMVLTSGGKTQMAAKPYGVADFYLRCTKVFNVVIRVSQFYTFPTQQE